MTIDHSLEETIAMAKKKNEQFSILWSFAIEVLKWKSWPPFMSDEFLGLVRQTVDELNKDYENRLAQEKTE